MNLLPHRQFSIRCLFAMTIALLASCAAVSSELSPDEQSLAKSLNMDEKIAAEVKAAGKSIERLTGIDANYKEVLVDGIVVITNPSEGHQVLARLRKQLASTPYRAYLFEQSFGHGPDKVAVLKSDDHGYLAIVRTDGVNHDIDHEKVMEKYRQWEARYGLKLTGAGQDWLEAEFSNPPKDWQGFAQEVYAFCPDIVDQGTGDIAGLAQEMKADNQLYLWWD